MADSEDYKRLGTELSASAEQKSGSLKAEVTKSLSGVFDSNGRVITNEAGDPEDQISYTLFNVIEKQREHIEMIRKDASMSKQYVSHSVGSDGDELRSKMGKIVDWTADQGSTNIHTGNYTNTTYSVGDGGLSQNNFTNTLKTKLDGIASNANNYAISSDLLDEDNMSTNSATKVPSQQSVKAYVDANAGGGTIDTALKDGSTNAVTNNAVFDGLALKLNLAGGTMTGLVQEPYNLTDSATLATAKGVIDARATRAVQIMNQKGQTWSLLSATPAYRGQELTIIAIGAGTITHSNPMKGASGLFVTPNGSNLSVAANTVVKFVTNFAMNWYQVV